MAIRKGKSRGMTAMEDGRKINDFLIARRQGGAAIHGKKIIVNSRRRLFNKDKSIGGLGNVGFFTKKVKIAAAGIEEAIQIGGGAKGSVHRQAAKDGKGRG